MRTSIPLFALLVFASCERTAKQVDKELNNRLIQKFSEHSPSLWNRTNNEFYSRLKELNLFETEDDSISAIYELIAQVQDEGYYPDFFVDSHNPHTKQLISELKEIGFIPGDESAQTFLYPICNSVVTEIDFYEEDNYISFFGRTSPDSINISFALNAATMKTGPGQPNLNEPGLRKLLTLFFFSEMIKNME